MTFGGINGFRFLFSHTALVNTPNRIAIWAIVAPQSQRKNDSLILKPQAWNPCKNTRAKQHTVEKLKAFIKNLVHDQSLITPKLLQARFDASNDPEIRANPPLVPPPGGPGKETFISLDPRLATLQHRTMFVWGLQDKVNLVAGLEPFRVMPNADFVLLANCGHWAQWEHAARFNDLVLSFLRQP